MSQEESSNTPLLNIQVLLLFQFQYEMQAKNDQIILFPNFPILVLQLQM